MTEAEFPSLADIIADDVLVEALAHRAAEDLPAADPALLRLLQSWVADVDRGRNAPSVPPKGASSQRAAVLPLLPQQRDSTLVRAIQIPRWVAVLVCIAILPISAGLATLLAGDSTEPQGRASPSASLGEAKLPDAQLREVEPREIKQLPPELKSNWSNPIQSDIGASREVLMADSSWPKLLRAALLAKYALPTVPIWAGRSTGPAVVPLADAPCDPGFVPATARSCVPGKLQ